MNDLLFECQFKKRDKTVKGYVYLLVEHQSKPEKLLPLRVFSLCAGGVGQTRQTAPENPCRPSTRWCFIKVSDRRTLQFEFAGVV